MNWECRTDGHYDLVLGEECGRTTQPLQEVVSYVTSEEEYELPGDYKVVFETLCLAAYIGEVEFQRFVSSALHIDELELSVYLHRPRVVRKRIRDRLRTFDLWRKKEEMWENGTYWNYPPKPDWAKVCSYLFLSHYYPLSVFVR